MGYIRLTIFLDTALAHKKRAIIKDAKEIQKIVYHFDPKLTMEEKIDRMDAALSELEGYDIDSYAQRYMRSIYSALEKEWRDSGMLAEGFNFLNRLESLEGVLLDTPHYGYILEKVGIVQGVFIEEDKVIIDIDFSQLLKFGQLKHRRDLFYRFTSVPFVYGNHHFNVFPNLATHLASSMYYEGVKHEHTFHDFNMSESAILSLFLDERSSIRRF